MPSFWPCFSFQPFFQVVFNPKKLQNIVLDSVVLWRSKDDEEENEK